MSTLNIRRCKGFVNFLIKTGSHPDPRSNRYTTYRLATRTAGVIGDLFRAGDRFLRNRSPRYVPADLFRIRRFVPLVTGDRFRPGDSFRGTNRRDI